MHSFVHRPYAYISIGFSNFYRFCHLSQRDFFSEAKRNSSLHNYICSSILLQTFSLKNCRMRLGILQFFLNLKPFSGHSFGGIGIEGLICNIARKVLVIALGANHCSIITAQG